MKRIRSNATSNLKKLFCVITICLASLVVVGQQPFEGKIVYTMNTTSRGLYKLNSDIQGFSEEVVYITNDKFILFNVATQLINFIDLETDAVYVACPPLRITQKISVADLIKNTEEILSKGGYLKKLAQWNDSVRVDGLIDGYPGINYMTDTAFKVEGQTYNITYKANEICLINFLSPELYKAYAYFYGMPYYEHTSDIKQDCPAPMLKSVRYHTRSVKSMERMTPDAGVFTIPSDMKVVPQREFVKAYNKYMKGLNKTREKAGTSVEYTVPEDIWDF